MSNVTITDLRSHLRSDITFRELNDGQFFMYNGRLRQKVQRNSDSQVTSSRFHRAIRPEDGYFCTPEQNQVVTPVSVEIIIRENDLRSA